jgi:glycosyltransferase involved in cell wall biosynthesis
VIKVTHIITGLERGGAEMMLYKLLRRLESETAAEVISLTDDGSLGPSIRDCGVSVSVLGMRRGLPNPWAVAKLAQHLRRSRPNVVQTWMYHADFIGGLATKLSGSVPLAWGIRQSNLDPVHSKKLTRFTARLCARLSHRLPQRIVCCSKEAARIHIEMGYAKDKITIIPNGFDLEAFRPDPEARATLRQELGVLREDPLIGMVARFDPQKDHRTFIRAAALVLQRRSDVKFVFVGDGATQNNLTLLGWLKAVGVADRFSLLGKREDVARVLNAIDIASLSSAYGEGFPNVVGEAMACGVPCVVTDVGDSAWLVGKAGRVVPVKHPEALARAWLDLLESDSSERRTIGAIGRARVSEQFEIGVIAHRYRDLWLEMSVAAQTETRVRAG